MTAATALAIAPDGFTVADLAARVRTHTDSDYTSWQAAYDLRKLRGKQLASNPAAGTATPLHGDRPGPAGRTD